MGYWRSGIFWASLILGWFVTLFCLAVLVHTFGSDHMTPAEGMITQVVIHALAIAAGHEYGRNQWKRADAKR